MSHSTTKHTLVEDFYGLSIGIIFIVVGLVYLKSAGIITGGIAGVALLVSYLVPIPIAILFTVVNIPFFIFSFFSMGWYFTLKTIITNIAITTLMFFIPKLLVISHINITFAAIIGGTTIGMGVLSLARHSAGVGGTGVITLWLQKNKGINAGKVQVLIDCFILLVSLSFFTLDKVWWSAVSAMCMSLMVIAWHKPGRYTGY